MTYVKTCPKCGSTIIKQLWDKNKKRVVNRSINCNFKGDTLFEDVDLGVIEAKRVIIQNARRDNKKT